MNLRQGRIPPDVAFLAGEQGVAFRTVEPLEEGGGQFRLCPETKVTYAEHSANTSPYACSFDDSAIRKELGYAPEWSIEDSVKDYIRVVMGRD